MHTLRAQSYQSQGLHFRSLMCVVQWRRGRECLCGAVFRLINNHIVWNVSHGVAISFFGRIGRKEKFIFLLFFFVCVSNENALILLCPAGQRG